MQIPVSPLLFPNSTTNFKYMAKNHTPMAREHIQILKLLRDNSEQKFSINQIAKKRKINYKSAYNAIKKLKAEKVIKVEKIANAKIISLSYKTHPFTFEMEYLRKEKILKNKNFKVLHQWLKELELPFIVLLFGSHAKGNSNKHSDIDLLIISDHEEKIDQKISLLPLPLHCIYVKYKEFISMALSKEFTAVSESIKDNVLLFGVDEYYRIIENVNKKSS